MSTATYKGVIRGQGIVLLEGDVPLPDGTKVLVTPLIPQPGTAEAVLAAVNTPPFVTKEDVEELEKAIAQGKKPLVFFDPFSE